MKKFYLIVLSLAISIYSFSQNYQMIVSGPDGTYSEGQLIDLCWDGSNNQSFQLSLSAVIFNLDIPMEVNPTLLTFHWFFGDGGSVQEGLGIFSITHNFLQAQGYIVDLVVDNYDTQSNPLLQFSKHCSIKVRVAMPPSWVTTTLDVNTICPGEPVLACTYLNSRTWAFPAQIISGCIPLPDPAVVPECYNSETSYSFDGSYPILLNVNDIAGINLNLYHNRIGDLSIRLICPNGQFAFLHNQGGGNCTLGVPGDCVCGSGNGIPWTYTISPAAIQDMATTAISLSSLPAGTYLPSSPLDALIGCPLSGTWTLSVCDNWTGNCGLLENWNINFNGYSPSNINFSYTQTYSVQNWSGTFGAVIPTPNNTDCITTTFSTTSTPLISSTQNYTVSIKDNFQCIHQKNLPITIKPINDPSCNNCNVPIAGKDTIVCGNSYNFNGIIAAGNNCTWSCLQYPFGMSSPAINNASQANASVNVGNNYGQYTFVITEKSPSLFCIRTDTIIVFFKRSPIAVFSTTTIKCFGDQTTIQYTGDVISIAPADFIWNFDNASFSSGTGQGPYQVSWNTSGQHSVSLLISGDDVCASDLTSLTIDVPEQLSNTVEKNNSSCNLCNGSASINVLGGISPYNFIWSNEIINNNELCSGNYSVTVEDYNKCKMTIDFHIGMESEFTINTSPDMDICKGHSVTLQANVVNQVDPLLTFNFVWKDLKGNTENVQNITITPLESTVYIVVVSDGTGCSVTSNPIAVNVHEIPSGKFTMNPVIVTASQPIINFTNHSIDATKYFWDFGDETTSNMTNPSHQFKLDHDIFRICMLASNDFGCEYTYCANINAYEYLTFYVPTYFSPNGDGENECFRPCGTLIVPTTFKMEVLDRFGNIVYNTTQYFFDDLEDDCAACDDQPGAWTGRRYNDGEFLPNGTYVWHCEFIGKDGIKYNKKGTVTLLR
ncbi:MAG: gliding motility-associated C-terminal domain-containing protein [Bacteroidales bacterium]|jgi:subtilisin-like proprotein convertase family protein|nr:gliding motility-associated C-terminal domain-containing protein [Bacteroidales bacterium]